ITGGQFANRRYGFDDKGECELGPRQPGDDGEGLDDELVGDPSADRLGEGGTVGDRCRKRPADQRGKPHGYTYEQDQGPDEGGETSQDGGRAAGHSSASSTALAVSTTVIVRSAPGRMCKDWTRVTVTVMSASSTTTVPRSEERRVGKDGRTGGAQCG